MAVTCMVLYLLLELGQNKIQNANSDVYKSTFTSCEYIIESLKLGDKFTASIMNGAEIVL